MGTSLIDDLFVSIGLDTSKFRKGQQETRDESKKTKDELRRDANDTEESAKRAGQSLEKLQSRALLLFGAFTAGRGIKDFIRDTIGADAALGRTAYTLDSTIGKLGAWAGAGRMVGASSDEIIGSFQQMTSEFQNFSLTGESQVIPYFRALGINIANSKGQMRDMGDVFLDLADKMHAMDPARAAAFGKAMGLSPGMINLLIQGRQAVEDYLKTAKQYAPTPKDVENAQMLARAWNQLEMSSTRMGRTFLTELGPGLKIVLDMLTGIADWLNEHPVALTIVLGALTAAVIALSTALTVGLAGTAFTAVMRGFGLLAGFLPNLFMMLGVLTETLLPGLAEGFLATGVAIEAMLGPIGWIIAALTALGIAGKWAWDNLDPKDKDAIKKMADFDQKNQRAAESGETLPEWMPDWLTGRNGKKDGQKAPPPPTKAGPLADLIGRGEGSYNSVNLGQRGGYQSSKRDLENMTVAQVMAAQQRGEFNAAGRYQIIKGTLADAAKGLGLKGDEKFNAGLQDRIFKDFLLNTKQKAIGDYVSGRSNDLNGAMKAASKEWASVADPDTGRSHYDGTANNKASISPADLARALQATRQANLGTGAQPVGAPQAAAAAAAPAGANVSHSTSEAHIGTVNFNGTGITDAPTAAAGLKAAVERNSFAQQANSGMG